MSQENELAVLPRAGKSKRGELRFNRNNGVIPAVLYGLGEPETLWVARKALDAVLHRAHSANALLSLAVEGSQKKKQTVLLKAIARDVVYDTPIHVDFLRVSIHQKVEVAVAVHVSGEASGVKNQGGILEHLLREVKIRCLASDIPAAITVDVAPLEIGASVSVHDLTLPKGVELITPGNHVVLNIVAPKVEEVAAPAVDAMAPAAPEVIAKGKKLEEGAEAPPAPGAAKAPPAASKPEGSPKK